MPILTVPFEMSELVEYFLHRHFLTARLCAVAPGASLPGGQQLLSGSAPNNEQRPSRKQGGRGRHIHTAIDSSWGNYLISETLVLKKNALSSLPRYNEIDNCPKSF